MQAAERPIEQVDAFLSASRLAHEVVHDLHRELVAVGRSTAQADELLKESADLTLRAGPQAVSVAAQLAAKFEEQAVLDPEAAEETLSAFIAELDRVKLELQSVRDRQRNIARDLRSQLRR